MSKWTVIITAFAVAVTVALYFWAQSTETTTEVLQQEPVGQSLANETRPSQSSAKPTGQPSEPDLYACLADAQSDICLNSIGPKIEQQLALGASTFRVLFDRIDVNLASLADTNCGKACQAQAYGELGLLMQRCSRTWWGSGQTINVEAEGNWNLSDLRDAQRADALFTLEQNWLARECSWFEGSLKRAPTILAQAGIEDTENLAAAAELNSLAYIERSVELGFAPAGRHYYDAVVALNRHRLPEVGTAVAYQSDAARKAAQDRSQHTGQVIERLFPVASAEGLALRAQHAYHRYPSLDDAGLFMLDDKSLSEAEITSLESLDWRTKALEFATYQIAYDRLRGIPDEARFGLKGSPLWRGDFVMNVLDSNDLEIATTRADELLREIVPG